MLYVMDGCNSLIAFWVYNNYTMRSPCPARQNPEARPSLSGQRIKTILGTLTPRRVVSWGWAVSVIALVLILYSQSQENITLTERLRHSEEWHQRNSALYGVLSKKQLAIDEKALGLYHRDVVIKLENLAALYRATGRDSEAEKLEQQAARIRAIER